jgi:hypothetical protein
VYVVSDAVMTIIIERLAYVYGSIKKILTFFATYISIRFVPLLRLSGCD